MITHIFGGDDHLHRTLDGWLLKERDAGRLLATASLVEPDDNVEANRYIVCVAGGGKGVLVFMRVLCPPALPAGNDGFVFVTDVTAISEEIVRMIQGEYRPVSPEIAIEMRVWGDRAVDAETRTKTASSVI